MENSTRRVRGGAACGVCKVLRKTCLADCFFAQYFGKDRTAENQYRAIRQVFGHSHFEKLVRNVPVDDRPHTVASLLLEAERRIQYPVHGCSGAFRQELQRCHTRILELEQELQGCNTQILALEEDIQGYNTRNQARIFALEQDLQGYNTRNQALELENQWLRQQIAADQTQQAERRGFGESIRSAVHCPAAAAGNYQLQGSATAAEANGQTHFPQRERMSRNVRNISSLNQMGRETVVGAFHLGQQHWK